MEIVSVILLVVVLLLQITLFTMFFLEKQRNNHRNRAMISYIDRAVEGGVSNCKDEVSDMLDAFAKKTEERFKQQDEVLREMEVKTTEQLKGLLLDYAQAQEAANKINDFGTSLANIFDYDPLKAIQKGRKKEAS